MKLLFRLIVVLIVLVVVVGVVGYLWIDSLAKAGVEKGGTYALGVETRVESLSLSPFRGTMKMGGLNVANPQGFTSPHLMHSGTFDVEIEPGSLFGETIVVKKFELDGLDLHVEQKLPKSNVSVILDNLKRLGGEGAEPKTDKPEEGKKVKVDRITIRNVAATFHLPTGPVKLGPLKVEVPVIEMTEVTSDNADGVVVSELVGRIVPAVIAAVLEKGQGVVPPDVLNGLRGDLSSLTQVLGGQTQKLVQDVQGELQKVLGKGAGGILGDPNQAAGGIGKKVGGALEGLLGGKKDANSTQDDEKKKKKAGGLLEGLLGGKKEGE
jgi:hypothetical protein